MIYLISKQKSLFETDLYKEISFKDAKEYLWELKRQQFDTETMGLDPYTKPLLCYQLGHKENQFVFDHTTYPIALLKDLFEYLRMAVVPDLPASCIAAFAPERSSFELLPSAGYSEYPKFAET